MLGKFGKLTAIMVASAGFATLAQPAAAAAKGRTAPLTEVEIAAIKIICEDLSEDYAHYLDGRDYDKFTELFAPDGTWEVLKNKMVGRQAIRDYWVSRSKDWPAGYGRVHQMVNQVVTVIDRDHAVGKSFVMVYMFNNPNTAAQSLAPDVISRNDDEYVRTKDGWKIKRRTISTVASAAVPRM